MGIEKVCRVFLEERHKLAQSSIMDVKPENAPQREEIMFWKGVNAALDFQKILDKEVA